MTQVKLEGFVPTAPTQKAEFKINLKLHSILLLVGPDGSGKTQFAIEQLMLQLKLAQVGKKKITITYVSIDKIVAELLDDTNFKKDSLEAKRVYEQAHDILFNKIKNFTSYPANSDFVIVDTTGLDSNFRTEILKIGSENHYNVSAIIFNYDDKANYYIVNQDSGEKKRPHPGQMKDLKRAVSGEISKKEYTSIESIHFRDFNKYEISIEDYAIYDQYVLPSDGEYVIFGDIHGCFDEFIVLLKKNGFAIDENLKVTHPDKKTVLLVGDIIDKGYAIKEVVELVYANLDTFFMTIGNHENFVYKTLSGILKKGSLPSQEVIDEYFNSIEIFKNDEDFKLKFFKIVESMKSFYVHKNFIVTHAPCEKKYLGKISSDALKATRDFRYPKRKDFESFSEFMHEFDERTQFLRTESNEFHPFHVFGHVMSKEMSRYKNKINVDTGCVSGGELTSIIIDEDSKISQESVAAGDKIKDNKKQLHNFFYT